MIRHTDDENIEQAAARLVTPRIRVLLQLNPALPEGVAIETSLTRVGEAEIDVESSSEG